MDALQVYTLVEGFCQHSDRRCQHAGHGVVYFHAVAECESWRSKHIELRVFEYFFYLDSLFLADSDALLLLLLLLLLLGLLLLLLLLLGPLRESVGHVALQLRRISLP